MPPADVAAAVAGVLSAGGQVLVAGVVAALVLLLALLPSGRTGESGHRRRQLRFASQRIAVTSVSSPGALQLRTLRTLTEIAGSNNSTLVFPVPVELLEAFKGRSS